MVSPEDISLVRDVGRALIMTHDYNRAIKFYETTLLEDPKLVSDTVMYAVGPEDGLGGVVHQVEGVR